MKIKVFATILSIAFLAVQSPAVARDFFSDLSGQWSGSGQAYLKKVGDISANCKLSVNDGDRNVSMMGNCRFLLFRQSLGLNLKTAGGGRVTGTYSGARTGPAQLSGTVKGDRLVLAVTWGGVVNGDRKAQMVLRRTGQNTFEQTVVDQVNGATKTTSQFAFKRN
ncbi:hypothetical protein [Pararhizobium sp. PWRC1-1]|uniref:hypothetical protein n=1 Tax=Pararhizobium sp. PWRC1-1 TaxID=2804566 RepID=UPI003CFA40BD